MALSDVIRQQMVCYIQCSGFILYESTSLTKPIRYYSHKSHLKFVSLLLVGFIIPPCTVEHLNLELKYNSCHR